MAVKKPGIGDLKTIAIIQSNVAKIEYGYSKVGSGFLDKYTDFKTVRGRFEQTSGFRTLADGSVIPVRKTRFIFRFETALNNILNLQLRLKVYGKIYTLENVDYIKYGRNDFFVFTLQEYGK